MAQFTTAALIAFLLPLQTFAWGANAERLIGNRAVETLPPDLHLFFEANRDFITRHAAEIRQLSDAAADVGSYWLTSWVNAGRPAPPRQ